MATRVIDDTKLNDIAVAIQAKDSGGQMTVDEMPNRIEALPEIVDENAALVLIDWEGTLLRSYTRDEVMTLTAFPNPSTLPNYAYADHDLLTFQEWNWDLADIIENLQNRPYGNLLVGAIYTTNDGQDHNYWADARLETYPKLKTKVKRGTTTFGALTYYQYHLLKNINIPKNSTFSDHSSFYDSISLRHLNIPKEMTVLNSSFHNCCNLKSISLPKYIKEIKGQCFNSCTQLKRLFLNKDLEIFCDGIFSYQRCRNLLSINIPKDSAATIYSGTFYECDSLLDIVIEGTPILANTDAFFGNPSTQKIYVPRANLSFFETETNWASIYSSTRFQTIEDNIDYLERLGFDVNEYKEVI